jgi:hypothetical protein
VVDDIAVAGAATADAATLVPDVLADIVTVGDPARPVAENLARTATDLRITVARRMSVFSHCQRQ